jgi:DNA primase
VKCYKCKKQAKAREKCPNCGEIAKYRGVKGNRTSAIYGAGHLTGERPALFCEGEFDVMTAWQELRDLVDVATLGAATTRLDLATWGAYLLQPETILVLYDPDQAGQAGASYWEELTTRARSCSLPDGVKDINDYHTTGGDLRGWMLEELQEIVLA